MCVDVGIQRQRETKQETEGITMMNVTRADRVRNANMKANAAAVTITPEMIAQWDRGGHSRNNARDIANREGVAVGRTYMALSGRRF